MKIAFAGKGGVGKTTLCAWMADYLARHGQDVLMVDADTALSLGQANGVKPEDLPLPLSLREDLVRERIGSGYMHLNPDVSDLPEELSLELPVDDGGAGRKRLLVMGSVSNAGGGCACAANVLLKSLLAHLIIRESAWVLVDLEAGVEHLGRGTVADVDALVIVSEPSMRSLETAARVGALASELGLARQALVLNRCAGEPDIPTMDGLPGHTMYLPMIPELAARQLTNASVLDLEGKECIDGLCAELVRRIRAA